jgi:hypothetical protein
MANKIDTTTLKTVAFAAAKKSPQLILEHFCFYGDGDKARVQCFDSTVAIDAPFNEALNIAVPVKQFMAAVGGADDVTLSVKKKITVKTEKLRSSFGFLPTDDFPIVPVTNVKKKKVSAPILETFKRLYSFIDTNSNRTWSTGVLIDGGYGYATDNVVMVRDQLPDMGRIVIPARAIELLTRINKEPTHFAVQSNVIYFYFGDTWMRSSLLDDTWPLAADILDKAVRNNIFNIADIKDDLITLGKFDTAKGMGIVHFDGQQMTLNDTASDVHIDCDFDESKFNLELLTKVANVAELIHINWPAACYFERGTFEGVIVGVK